MGGKLCVGCLCCWMVDDFWDKVFLVLMGPDGELTDRCAATKRMCLARTRKDAPSVSAAISLCAHVCVVTLSGIFVK